MLRELKNQVVELEFMLLANEVDLRVEKRIHRINELVAARMEIFKSIAHRQRLMLAIHEGMVIPIRREAA